MAAALKALFDKRKLALTQARFRAWWDGADFNEETALAEIEAKLAAANDRGVEGADDELFDPEPYDMPPRLRALALMWGDGRVRPGDSADEAAVVARLELGAEATVAVLGPGGPAPLTAYAGVHPGAIDVFEWREETVDAVKHGALVAKLGARVAISRIDLEAYVFKPAHYDGLLSIDDFAYCSYPPHLTQQIMKCLKPGGRAVIDSYVGLPTAAFATAFATAFAEPHVRAHGDLLQFFADVGLEVVSDEDLTDAFLTLARDGFKRLSAQLAEAGDLDVIAAREMAWEAEAWRTRMHLLAQRRLERRRFVLRKPAEDQAENANTPSE
ncbi:MAG: hypothetical protein JNM59_08495 [Hyphomonadaceae bacterium]|nr:hypothetical protein [Hyphomonadaceae bacterium]